MSVPRKPTLTVQFAAARRLEGVTVHQWAAREGVSHMTVYRALRGSPEIPDTTRDRLTEAITRYVQHQLRAA